MAVTFFSSFEVQQTVVDRYTLTGTASNSATQARTGVRSIRCNPASAATGFADFTTTGGFFHFGLYVVTRPSVQRALLGVNNASGTETIVFLDSAGSLTVKEDTTVIGTSAVLSTATWYWIGVRQTSGTSVPFLQVNGVDSVTGTATGQGTFSVVSVGFFGTEASAAEIYIDDIIVDGAAFISNGKVDIALPISDNTRTAVTTGNGGTTNLWDAINNTPPTGVVSASETATTNIEYPASLTEDYIANLETYTTLGVASGDTVLAVQSIVQHGEDIVTGTKNFQNMGALTNPTVAGASVVAGADAGAHGATPTNWTTTFGTLTTSPSVTLGTSPTIRTSRTSESRVACIDFMGMLVAWTPAVATVPPSVKNDPIRQMLAH